ncbi:unnamed protein product [Dicrocoelium dendriticum]|nr:unnamed protein product [Dicrocoelium dendriticum]
MRMSEQKSFHRQRRRKSFLRSRPRKCMSLRDLAWRAHKDSQNSETWTAYVAQRNICVSVIREDKMTHQQELSKGYRTNRKRLYRHVNGLRKMQRGVPAPLTTDECTRPATEAADLIRFHYSQMFLKNNEPNGYPCFYCPTISFMQYYF